MTNTQIDGIADLQDAIKNDPNGRVRIGGGAGDDYEEGVARLVTADEPFGVVDYGNIVIAWDQGVTTVVPRELDDTWVYIG